MNSRTTRDKICDSITKTGTSKVPRYVNFPPTINAPSVGNPGMEGDIFFNRTTNTFYGHDGQIWRPLGGDLTPPIDALYVVLAANPSLTNERILTPGTGILINDGGAGGPVTVFLAGTACSPANAQYVTAASDTVLTNERVLTAGTGITVIDGGANGPITVAATGVGLITNATLVDVCPTAPVTLNATGSSPNFMIQGLLEGTGITLSSDSSCIVLAASASVLNTNVTLTDACISGISLVADGSGPDLQLRGLVAGTGVVLTSDGTCFTASANNAAFNTAINLTSPCTAINLVADGSGPDLELKGLIPGIGVILSSDSSCVTLGVSGTAVLNSAVTLSNACGTGESLVSFGTGPNLAIKGLLAGTAVTFSDTGSCVIVETSATAPGLDAEFVLAVPATGLPNSRVLTAGTSISIVDSGPGGTITISTTPGTTLERIARVTLAAPFTGITTTTAAPGTLTILPGTLLFNSFTDGSTISGGNFVSASFGTYIIDYNVTVIINSADSTPVTSLTPGVTIGYDVEAGMVFDPAGVASFLTNGRSAQTQHIGYFSTPTDDVHFTLRGILIQSLAASDSIALGVRISAINGAGPGPGRIDAGHAIYSIRRVA